MIGGARYTSRTVEGTPPMPTRRQAGSLTEEDGDKQIKQARQQSNKTIAYASDRQLSTKFSFVGHEMYG